MIGQIPPEHTQQYEYSPILSPIRKSDIINKRIPLQDIPNIPDDQEMLNILHEMLS